MNKKSSLKCVMPSPRMIQTSESISTSNNHTSNKKQISSDYLQKLSGFLLHFEGDNDIASFHAIKITTTNRNTNNEISKKKKLPKPLSPCSSKLSVKHKSVRFAAEPFLVQMFSSQSETSLIPVYLNNKSRWAVSWKDGNKKPSTPLPSKFQRRSSSTLTIVDGVSNLPPIETVSNINVKKSAVIDFINSNDDFSNHTACDTNVKNSEFSTSSLLLPPL